MLKELLGISLIIWIAFWIAKASAVNMLFRAGNLNFYTEPLIIIANATRFLVLEASISTNTWSSFCVFSLKRFLNIQRAVFSLLFTAKLKSITKPRVFRQNFGFYNMFWVYAMGFKKVFIRLPIGLLMLVCRLCVLLTLWLNKAK